MADLEYPGAAPARSPPERARTIRGADRRL